MSYYVADERWFRIESNEPEPGYCMDCKCVVNARRYADFLGGTQGLICPESRAHDVIGVKKCAGCGELISEEEKLCHSCKSEVDDWWGKRPTFDEDSELIDYIAEEII